MEDLELKYKNLHETNSGYQNNNWMMDEIEFIRKLQLNSIIEIGCGNGKFLKEVSKFIPSVVGVDLVKSPLITEEGYNFYQRNIITEELDFKSDLLVSADVMEHFKESDIPAIIGKFTKISDNQMHIIACYDDGHSHETIKTPDEWLELFSCISDDFRLLWTKKRKERDICCISNF